MKRVLMYQSVDGTLFTDEAKCAAHIQDCIGQEFDAILLEATQAANGNVTRNDQYKMCIHMLKNRAKLLPTLKNLVNYIETELEPADDEDA